MGRRRNKHRSRGRLRDPGPDQSGNYDVSPYAARGHVIEVAPKDLRSNPNSQAFPKRIATQRMIDRYFRAGHIDEREWKAATSLWELWCDAGLEAKVTSGYEPVTTNGQASQDHKIAKRVDGAREFVDAIDDVPYRSRGVVNAVVVLDWSASQWAAGRGLGRSDSERLGMMRLRAGLSALADAWGY